MDSLFKAFAEFAEEVQIPVLSTSAEMERVFAPMKIPRYSELGLLSDERDTVVLELRLTDMGFASVFLVLKDGARQILFSGRDQEELMIVLKAAKLGASLAYASVVLGREPAGRRRHRDCSGHRVCLVRGAGMKFRLDIELGNDAMQTSTDIRNTLATVQMEVGIIFDGSPVRKMKIRDTNGNTVGFWEIVEDVEGQ